MKTFTDWQELAGHLRNTRRYGSMLRLAVEMLVRVEGTCVYVPEPNPLSDKSYPQDVWDQMAYDHPFEEKHPYRFIANPKDIHRGHVLHPTSKAKNILRKSFKLLRKEFEKHGLNLHLLPRPGSNLQDKVIVTVNSDLVIDLGEGTTAKEMRFDWEVKWHKDDTNCASRVFENDGETDLRRLHKNVDDSQKKIDKRRRGELDRAQTVPHPKLSSQRSG